MIFLEALAGKNRAKRPPIWLMRQAGRYMHEYQSLRKRYTFLELCHDPELISEVTQMPIKAFGMDAAILFSDILLICQALGFNLKFDDALGPIIENPLETIQELHLEDVVSRLDFVLQGIRLVKQNVKVPLIGFAGAPFTVASYLIEGRSSRDLRKTKKWLLEDPASFSKLLDQLADATIDYLNAQIDAGCDALQLFDSWAIYLAQPQFEAYVAKPLEKILQGLKRCPVILFCRGASCFYERLATLPCQAISLDWQSDLAQVRQKVPHIALQGNLDPDILLQSPKVVQREARGLLERMHGDPGFIFNLGHGVLKETPRENVAALVDCIKNYGN